MNKKKEIEKQLENLLHNSKEVTKLLDKGNNHIVNIHESSIKQENEINKSSKTLNKIMKSFYKLRSWVETKDRIDVKSYKDRYEDNNNNNNVGNYIDNILNETQKHQEQIKFGNDILDENIYRVEENTIKIEGNRNKVKKFMN